MAVKTKLTRRLVLKRSAASFAALTAPHLVPTGVLARAGRSGANDRIVIGGIGVRRMGGCLIRGMARLDGVHVAAVADVDGRVAEAIATPREEDRVLWGSMEVPSEPADLTNVDRYQDYRHILDRKDIGNRSRAGRRGQSHFRGRIALSRRNTVYGRENRDSPP